MHKIRFVDLFSGIGGIRLALEQAANSLNIESECVLSSEINSDAQLVYEKNFAQKSLGDIRLIDKLPEHEYCDYKAYYTKAIAFASLESLFLFPNTPKPQIP
ncbi:DNA cytosine methyltransferase [Nostoc sp.]|uniref:DNA cytosine methyltransferase n=1 Tax=Nostoc sp. TaxID=1180 RepID=UPI002FF49302